MGDELLKKTGAGKPVMVFGEPDVDLAEAEGGQVIVEGARVDVFDDQREIVRAGRTTSPAGSSHRLQRRELLLRHAYFLGAQEPYEKLKRALRAESTRPEWAKLYASRSVPFAGYRRRQDRREGHQPLWRRSTQVYDAPSARRAMPACNRASGGLDAAVYQVSHHPDLTHLSSRIHLPHSLVRLDNW